MIMKKIILHINILFILILLTSFDDEKANTDISNFYEISSNALSKNIVVTEQDQNGNTNYLFYNEASQLTQIDYNENSFKKFHYNDKGQLIKIEKFEENELVDKEIINWNDSRITKVDFSKINKVWIADYKEVYTLNTFGQVEQIRAFYNEDNKNWTSAELTIQYNWEFNKLVSIETEGTKFRNNIALIEKLDLYTDIEPIKKIKKPKKEIIEVTFSKDFEFTPISDRLFDINHLIQNNTSIFYISFWTNGKRKEVVKYSINANSYPLQFEVLVSNNSRSYKRNYSIELI